MEYNCDRAKAAAEDQNKPQNQSTSPTMGMKIMNVRSMAEISASTDVSKHTSTMNGIDDKRRCNVLNTNDFNGYLISLD